MAESLPIADFSGGLNENPLKAAPNQYTKAENFLVGESGDGIFSRPGSQVFDLTYPYVGAQRRVDSLFMGELGKTIFASSGPDLFAYGASGWSQLSGPDNAQVLGTASKLYRPQFIEWRNHLISTGGACVTPIKVYRDDENVLQVRTAGLPFLETGTYTVLDECIRLANDLRTMVLFHFVGTSPVTSAKYHAATYGGAQITDTVSNAMVTEGQCYDRESMLALTAELLTAYGHHERDARKVAGGTYHWTTTLTASGVYLGFNATLDELYSSVLTTESPPETVSEAADALDDLLIKFQRHQVLPRGHASAITSESLTESRGRFPKKIRRVPELDEEAGWGQAYVFANQLKDQFLQHMRDSLPGLVAVNHKALQDHSFYTGITYPGMAADPLSLANLVYYLIELYNLHATDALAGSPTYHNSQSTTTALITAAVWTLDTTQNAATIAYWKEFYMLAWSHDLEKVTLILNEIKSRFNTHENDTVHTNHGNYPFRATDLQSASYAYSFCYHYKYVIGGVTFEDFGPVTELDALVTVSIDQSGGLVIKNIPALVNGTQKHYDTDNVTIQIYRTTDGGTTPYLVADIPNGTTEYTDTTLDVALINSTVLYTVGGVLDNEPPPVAKFVTYLPGPEIALYGNIIDRENNEIAPQRIRQSVGGDLDSCPSDLYVDLPEANTGLSSVKDIPIAWTAKVCYRLEGLLSETGQGEISAIPITGSGGMVASYSPVQVAGGVVFAGIDGFYFTDAYQIVKLSDNWNVLFAQLARDTDSQLAITGTYDEHSHRVWYGCSEYGTDADKCFILDLNYGMKPDACWTTASNGANFAPTALAFYKGELLRGDSRGYVFIHKDALATDPEVDTSTAASTWDSSSFVWDYVSPAFNFGTDEYRKWVTKLEMKAHNRGNLSLQIYSINDIRPAHALAPILYQNPQQWGDVTEQWETAATQFGENQTIDEKRYFPSGSLRCSNKQIRMLGTGTAEKFHLISYTLAYSILGQTQSDAGDE